MTVNLVGDESSANSVLNAGGGASSGLYVEGNNTSISNLVDLSNSTIANLTASGTGSGVSLRGIFVAQPTYAGLTNCSIHDLQSSSSSSNDGTAAALAGIVLQAAQTPLIQGAMVHGLRGISASGSPAVVNGIWVNGGIGVAQRNRVWDLTNSAGATGAAIRGFYQYGGSWTFANNQISISNASNTGPMELAGVYQNIAASIGSADVLFNSIYIGGTQLSGASNSYAFLRQGSFVDLLNDNLLYNDRDNGGSSSGSHYAVGTSLGGNWSANYNLLVSPDASKLAQWQSLDRTLVTWRTASGGDANSLGETAVNTPALGLFVDPAIGVLDVRPTTDYQAPPLVSNAGIAIGGQASDFGGTDARSATPDIGSDEITVSRMLSAAGSFPAASPNYPGMLDDLTLTGGGAPTLTGDLRISGALTLQGGNITTGAHSLTLLQPATVSRTSGQVVGTLRKYVGVGRRGPVTFEIGSPSDYAPVDVRFPAGVTMAGYLGASTTASEHPQVATSGVDASRDVNRFWSLTPGGVGFGTADVTLHFAPGDVDAGATPANFSASRYDGSTWTTPAVGTRTMTSTQATGLTALGDLVAGEPRQVVITASAGAGGVISPSGAVSVTLGASQAFTITADPGQHIADVMVDGASQGAIATYTFTAVAAAHTISASFAPNSYSITVTGGTGGTVTPGGIVTVAHGADQAFSFTPDLHFHVVDVKVDGASQGALAAYTFTNVTTSHELDVTFAPDSFSLSASAGAGGSISPSGAVSVGYGGSQSFTISPATGHVILDVLVDDVSVGAVGSYSFSAVDAPHTIAASFALVNQLLTLNTVGTGTIAASPSGPEYPYGTVVTLTAHPGTGFAFTGWSGDASGSVNPISVTMNGDRAATATFEAIATAVSAVSPGGTLGPATPSAVIPIAIARTSAEPIAGVSVTSV
ncbi:MAG: InlB B-repeat-containing protein, partial [Candidatus Eiseniibacteriota bacterium]